MMGRLQSMLDKISERKLFVIKRDNEPDFITWSLKRGFHWWDDNGSGHRDIIATLRALFKKETP